MGANELMRAKGNGTKPFVSVATMLQLLLIFIRECIIKDIYLFF